MTAQKVRTCCSRSTLTEQGASPQLRACELARSPSTRRASKSPIEEILAQRLVERHTFGEDDMLAVAERFEAGRIAARDAIRRSAPGCAVRATISAMRRSPRCAPKAERPGSWNCRAIAGGNIYGTEKRGGGRPFGRAADKRVAEPFPWETRWRQGSGLCGLRPRCSGAEERNSRWADSKRSYNAGYGIKSVDDLHAVIAFFEERRGRLHGFRWKDWSDYKSADDVCALPAGLCCG